MRSLSAIKAKDSLMASFPPESLIDAEDSL